MSLGRGGGSRNTFEVGTVAPSTAKALPQRAPSVQRGANPLLLQGAEMRHRQSSGDMSLPSEAEDRKRQIKYLWGMD